MRIEILIDKLTPCLKRVETGEILQTTFSMAKDNDLIDTQKKGWNFDWSDEKLLENNIYKLTLKDDDVIQGLISARIERGAIYVELVESAPHNLGKAKEYEGVGGHLFAIAIKLSLALGFGGYVYMDAKNLELVEHYSEKLGAERVNARIHEYRMEISEENAQKIIEQYTLEGDLNVR
jgi:hypothetical protein